MDFIKQSLARIQAQLGALTLSQRMLAVSLAAIMVVTVLFWGRYAATPEMVSILDQGFSSDQAARIQGTLERQNIKVTVASDGRIMVPADSRMQALAAMAYNKQMPSNYATALEKIASQSSLWNTSAQTEQIRMEKLQLTLGMMISEFPGVESAHVTIDTAEKRSLTTSIDPTATVFIKMADNNKPPKHLIMAAANAVMGAKSGLSANNVKVIVDGIGYPVTDESSGGIAASGEILENKLQWERYNVEKVRQVLASIPGALVGVSVDLDTKRIESDRYEVNPKNFIQKEAQTSETKDESTLPSPGPTETGAVPNTGTGGPTPAQGSGGGTLKEDGKTTFENDWGKERIRTSQPPGNGVVTAATVQIPRSHFLKMWKQLNPKATAEPDEATLLAVVNPELDRVRKAVMACTNLKSADAVMVDSYFDGAIDLFATEGSGGGGGGGSKVLAVVGGYGREVVLAALALAALMMVSGIVKKGAGPVPAAQIAAIAEQQRELERLVGGEEVVGAAGEGTSALEALELDEETGQTQQMVQQVANMVKENPDAATSLVKRWMNRM